VGGEGWVGTVRRSVFQGDHTDYLVEVGVTELRVRSYGEAPFVAVGQTVTVRPDLTRIRLHAGSRTSTVVHMSDTGVRTVPQAHLVRA
jgi:hypothetical protein